MKTAKGFLGYFVVYLAVALCFGQINLVAHPTDSLRTEIIANTKVVIYRVNKGETLYSISKKYNVSVSELTDLNPELSNGLKSDATIKIPIAKNITKLEEVHAEARNSDKNENLEYVVQKGETYYSLGKKFKIPVEKLIEVNGKDLKAGQVIIIGKSNVEPVVRPIKPKPTPKQKSDTALFGVPEYKPATPQPKPQPETKPVAQQSEPKPATPQPKPQPETKPVAQQSEPKPATPQPKPQPETKPVAQQSEPKPATPQPKPQPETKPVAQQSEPKPATPQPKPQPETKPVAQQSESNPTKELEKPYKEVMPGTKPAPKPEIVDNEEDDEFIDDDFGSKKEGEVYHTPLPGYEPDENFNKKVLVIPFDPYLYFSDADDEISKVSKISKEKVRTIFRRRLNALLDPPGYEVIHLMGGTAKDSLKDLDRIYRSLSYFKQTIVYDSKKNPDASTGINIGGPEETWWEKQKKKVGSQNFTLATRERDELKYYGVKINDPEFFPYFNGKYGINYYLFINQFEVKTDYDHCLDRARQDYRRYFIAHFTILDSKGIIVAGNKIKIHYNSNSNSVFEIVNDNMQAMADAIMKNLP